MNKTVIVIILAIILVAAGVGAYFLVFSGNSDQLEIRVEHPTGEQFTTNLKGSQTRFLRTGVVIVVNKTGLEDFITAENNNIRDTIIFILRDLTEEEARAEGTQDILRTRMISALNERLGIENIVEIRFYDYVVA